MRSLFTTTLIISGLLLVPACGPQDWGGGRDVQVFSSHHANGQLAFKGEYINNKMDGPWISWYETGTKASEENYQAGILHGRKAKWDKDGSIREEAWYKDGKLHGRMISWDARGNILLIANYEDDKEISRQAKSSAN